MKETLQELTPIAIQRACRLAFNAKKLSTIQYVRVEKTAIIVKFEQNYVVSLDIHHLICNDEDFDKMVGIKK